MKSLKFLESICYEHGEYPLLEFHQKRLNDVFYNHFDGHQPHQLSAILPNLSFSEKHKVRVLYDHENIQIEFSQYQLRPLQSIKIVRDDDIAYPFKLEDRSSLQILFDQREGADEIIIVKQDKITDSFYANIVLWDGSQWITPSTYLLNGVRRQFLLNQGSISEQKITISDLKNFEKISLINAMMDLGESLIGIDQLIY